MTTNISTATNPMYAVTHHHEWVVSAYIGYIGLDTLDAVTISVDDIILLPHDNCKKTIITTTNTFVSRPSITTAR